MPKSDPVRSTGMASLFYMTYLEKLKHPNWQKKRLLILERDNFTCRYCGDKETELQVHHLKYYGNPWETKDQYLICLCKDCHGLVTVFKDLGNIYVKKSNCSTGILFLFVRHNYNDVVIISIFEKNTIDYKLVFCFRQNGDDINKLISLNNV